MLAHSSRRSFPSSSCAPDPRRPSITEDLCRLSSTITWRSVTVLDGQSDGRDLHLGDGRPSLTPAGTVLDGLGLRSYAPQRQQTAVNQRVQTSFGDPQACGIWPMVVTILLVEAKPLVRNSGRFF